MTIKTRSLEEIAEQIFGSIVSGSNVRYADILAALREAADAAREEGREEVREGALVNGCIEVVAILNRRFGATSYADAVATVEKRIAEARQEEREALRRWIHNYAPVTPGAVLGWLNARSRGEEGR